MFLFKLRLGFQPADWTLTNKMTYSKQSFSLKRDIQALVQKDWD